AGATLGGIVGASITASLAEHVPAAYLLLGSAALLEVAIFSVRRLSRLSGALRRRATSQGETAIGGTVLSGLTHAFKSAYLFNVSLYILLYATTSTFLYFQQAEIACHSFINRGARTVFFVRIDLCAIIVTLFAQFFSTGWVIRALRGRLRLTLLPGLSIVGFTTF